MATVTRFLQLHSDREVLKTRILTAVVIISNVIGNVTLSHGMRQVGSITRFEVEPYLRAFVNGWVVIGVVVLALWMPSELALLSRADLSFVLPVTSISYVLIALTGQFLLREHISALHWAGILVITTGVVLVGETPPRTTDETEVEEE